MAMELWTVSSFGNRLLLSRTIIDKARIMVRFNYLPVGGPYIQRDLFLSLN